MSLNFCIWKPLGVPKQLLAAVKSSAADTRVHVKVQRNQALGYWQKGRQGQPDLHNSTSIQTTADSLQRACRASPRTNVSFFPFQKILCVFCKIKDNLSSVCLYCFPYLGCLSLQTNCKCIILLFLHKQLSF